MCRRGRWRIGIGFAAVAGMNTFPKPITELWPRPLLLSAVACAGLLGGCNTPTQETATTTTTGTAQNAPAQTATPEKPRAFVRGVHVVPGAGAAMIAVNGKTVTPQFTYGNGCDFVAVEPGELKITAIGTNGKSIAGPMPVELERGEDMTVVVNGVPGDIALLPFKHKNGGPEKGQAKVAFLHGAKALPEVDVFIDNERYRGDIEYGEATDYKVLNTGRHAMQLRYTQTLPATPIPTPILPPGAKVIATAAAPKPREQITLTQELDLGPDKVYSVVVFHDAARLPKLRLLEDKFASTLQNAPETDAQTTATPPDE
ncbi:MAG: hypothetical protein JWN98_2715 [Abditibacteriota bacterium]|nr:hypothetical protein [Abditibacteriota bacterium]